MFWVGIYNLVWHAITCFTILAAIYLIVGLFRAGTTTTCDCEAKKDKEKEREKRRRRRQHKEEDQQEQEEGDGEEEQKEGDKEPDPDENKEPDVDPEPEPELDEDDEEEEEEDEEDLIEWFYVEQDENANGVPQTSVTIEWEGVLRPLDGYRFRYRCYTYDNNTDKESVSAFTNFDVTSDMMTNGTCQVKNLQKSTSRYDREYEFTLCTRANVRVEDIDEEWIYMDY